ncbi:uncharacterized protein mbd6 isoform 2-T2 [Xenentodon cancila]
MMGGSETVSGDTDGVHTASIHVPIGWQRKVEGGQVIYVSPSGTALSTLDQVKTYLLTDGTCKCGLECPVIIHKVFNFSVGVRVEQPSQPFGKPEQDMTKLCNHRRKVVAMAALCRSMQASQLPFANFHHPDVRQRNSRDPNLEPAEGKEEDRGICYPKLHPVPARLHNNLHPNPCASPKSSHQFIYPYNGSSPILHTATNSHRHLEDLKRLHNPSFSASSNSSSNSSFSAHNTAQRSPRTTTPQSMSQGQRTPKTPETPSSPRLGSLSSPPSSSPMTLGGGVRGAQTHTHHPHPVIVGAPPLSPSLSLSPFVHNLCASPNQRSRHPSASPSSLSEQRGSSTAAEGGGLMGNNACQRRKSTSSSPHSPVPSGSPNSISHFSKCKLEDILEQFKNSGNSSSNNHHFLNPTNPPLLINQSSSNAHPVSSKPSKNIMLPTSNAGPPGFGLNSAGPSSLPLGPMPNHNYSHQGKVSQASFPASSLLSAAAKAQLATQISQGQSSNMANHPGCLSSSLDATKEAQQQQKVTTDGGDTLIPVSLQGKDNPILQQLLPTLLNPALLGDISGITGLHNMVGIGAGSILLSPVQASALGMSLLQGPDGVINLLNNIQLNLAPPSDGEKADLMQESQSPAPQEDIPAREVISDVVPSPGPSFVPSPAQESTAHSHRGSEGRPVIDPYTSFMDTIYTSFLQVSAKEQEDGAQVGPSDPTSPFCALPPVSFPLECHTQSTTVPTLPQASAPVSLSPRRACSLRNPDLSRLSLEAAAHSPAQGTPKPTEDGPTSPLQRKPVIEGHTHLEPPLPPIYLEEAKTDCTGPATAVCPFVETGIERQGHLSHAGYLSPTDRCSGRPNEETTGTLLHTEQGTDQVGAAGGARRGRKRKQTLQNVLEDFRDMDATALEETKATTAFLKPERSVRGRRRRGTRSQRQ